MAPRRWLLVVLSLGSLVILAYAGVLLAFSVPIDQDMEAQARLPGQPDPASGRRALVIPLRDASLVPTFSGGGDAGEGSLDQPGAVLVVADDDPDFPAAAQNASIVRALARVTVDAEGRPTPERLELANLTRREGDNVTTYNVTLEVGSLLGEGGGPRSGFLVKPDATERIWFVPEDRVVGQVGGFESFGHILTTLILGAAGFTAPLVVLVVTHRPSGRPGLGEVFCAECRAPMPTASDFCPRCGAWKKGRDSA